MKSTLCKSCGAPILWLRYVKTEKATAIDEKPVLGGSIIIHPDGETYLIASPAARIGNYLHTNHFQTCSSAEQHRAKKG